MEDRPTSDEAPEGPLKPEELVGRSFLLEHNEEGERLRANIIRMIETYDDETQEKINTHFLCEIPEHRMDQIRDYHDLLEKLHEQSFKQDDETFFGLVSITAHQGPLTPQDPKYLGSAWNTLCNWEDGSSTYEPLKIIGKDMPDMFAQHALDNNLLGKPG